MVTHIGGLDAAAEATLNLPKIPGGKKFDLYTLEYAIDCFKRFTYKS